MEYKQHLNYIIIFGFALLITILIMIFVLLGLPIIQYDIFWSLFPVTTLIIAVLPLAYIYSKITYIKINNDSIFISFFKNFKKHDLFIKKDAIRSFKITQSISTGDSLGKITQIHVTLDDGKSYNISSDYDSKEIYDFFVNNNANIPHFESEEGLDILVVKCSLIPLILCILAVTISVGINNLYIKYLKLQNNNVQELCDNLDGNITTSLKKDSENKADTVRITSNQDLNIRIGTTREAKNYLYSLKNGEREIKCFNLVNRHSIICESKDVLKNMGFNEKQIDLCFEYKNDKSPDEGLILKENIFVNDKLITSISELKKALGFNNKKSN